MDKLGWISLLLDFYGPLLTDKQFAYMEMYYNNDLSLGEIAEEHSVSRQAVYDIIKRGEKILEEYENKLGLVKKFNKEREKLNQVAKIIAELKRNHKNDELDRALKLLAEVVEMETR
ncbi:putative helix-turn-helix protein YlxM/p13 family protein [Thermincola ferriacetica]|uniref:UPF0122 protein TherJR_2052 n=2 Tax=Thermincola TaxID=278993 RepID=D5X8M1_THEPJ|nr:MULTISPECIES: putative DNA-binding protein [Thermincola]ADG82897.1 putative helix-turn-helix protein YlxM/p13 family protein [Thermincola potens JR]KNZ69625.1 putative helix-turn-helix protein YlxM/p13 family protein [Thermincola ferriacetica]